MPWLYTWVPPRGGARTPGLAGEPESQAWEQRGSAPGHAGKPRAPPLPRTSVPLQRSPPLPPAAARRTLQPGPCPPSRRGIGSSRSHRAFCIPPLDWLRSAAEAPPISPGPLITRLQALPGPGSRPRAFLYGLQRREVRHGRVGWAAERWHGSTPRDAGVTGCRGPSALSLSLPPPA